MQPIFVDPAGFVNPRFIDLAQKQVELRHHGVARAVRKERVIDLGQHLRGDVFELAELVAVRSEMDRQLIQARAWRALPHTKNGRLTDTQPTKPGCASAV